MKSNSFYNSLHISTEYILKKNICILFYYCIIFHHNQSHCIKWVSELYFIFDKTFCINRSQELQDNCKISLAKKIEKLALNHHFLWLKKFFWFSTVYIEFQITLRTLTFRQIGRSDFFMRLLFKQYCKNFWNLTFQIVFKLSLLKRSY